VAIYCLHDDILKIKNKELNKDDILTFDDGHYSLYKYRELLKEKNCRKILFLTPSYVQMNHRTEEPDLSIYYQWDYRMNGKPQWLTIYEVEELVKNYNVELGMHSYYHDLVYVKGQTEPERMWRMYKISTDKNKMKILCKMYDIKSALCEQGYTVLNGYITHRNYDQFTEFIKSDTYLCWKWFKDYFGVPNTYAYPFFQGSIELDNELFKYGIKKENIFGKREHINNAKEKER